MHDKIALLTGLLLTTGTAAAATISGRVVDEATQQPIAGARLTVVGSFAGFPSFGPVTDTGTDGRYTFTLSDDQTLSIGIVAEAAGHAARDHGAGRCNAPGSCEPGSSALSVAPGANLVVDFALTPGARLHGRVTDLATGAPVADAAVELQTSVAGSFALQGGTRSDTNGDFVVEGLHAGSYTLTARPRYEGRTDVSLPHLRYVWPDLHCDDVQQRCIALPATPVLLTAGSDGGMFDVRLKRGAVVRARMRSLGNGAVVNQITRGAATVVPSGASAQSGADGYAYIGPLLPGPVSLALEPTAEIGYPAIVYPDQPCTSTPCDLTGAPTLAVPEASLVTAADVYVAPLRTISGRVTDAAGTARGGIRVSAGDVRFGIMGPSGFMREATTVTDGDGNYRLEGFYNDSLVVRTQAATDGWIDVAWPDTACDGANLFCEDYQAVYARLDLSTAPHPTGIDLKVRPGTALEGRVVGTDGAPKSSWFVALIPAGVSRAAKPVITDADGRFRLGGLSNEAYYVWASASQPANGAEGTLYPGAGCRLDYFVPPTPCDFAAATAVTPNGSGIGGLVVTVPPADSIFAAGFD